MSTVTCPHCQISFSPQKRLFRPSIVQLNEFIDEIDGWGPSDMSLLGPDVYADPPEVDFFQIAVDHIKNVIMNVLVDYYYNDKEGWAYTEGQAYDEVDKIWAEIKENVKKEHAYVTAFEDSAVRDSICAELHYFSHINEKI